MYSYHRKELAKLQSKLVFNPQIAAKKPENIVKSDSYCPFCDPSALTNVWQVEDDRIWLLNKYRTLEDTVQTVLIEDADHQGDLSTYSTTKVHQVIAFALKCWQKMLSDSRYQSVALYKNFGPLSGGSLRHPHLQAVGFEKADINEQIVTENFAGITAYANDHITVNLSTLPIMGFTEINVIWQDDDVNAFADGIQLAVDYTLNDYFNGRCNSYNLFFYQMDGKIIAKIVPRFVTSPYFIGYKIPQINTPERLKAIANELQQKSCTR
jgi:galactose-1-phosphate uridylyltransferase